MIKLLSGQIIVSFFNILCFIFVDLFCVCFVHHSRKNTLMLEDGTGFPRTGFKEGFELCVSARS